MMHMQDAAVFGRGTDYGEMIVLEGLGRESGPTSNPTIPKECENLCGVFLLAP